MGKETKRLLEPKRDTKKISSKQKEMRRDPSKHLLLSSRELDVRAICTSEHTAANKSEGSCQDESREGSCRESSPAFTTNSYDINLIRAHTSNAKATMIRKAEWRGVHNEKKKLLKVGMNNEQYIGEQLLQIASKLDACTETELKTRCSRPLLSSLLGASNCQQIMQRVCSQVYQTLFHKQFNRWNWLLCLNNETEKYVPASYSDRARDVDIDSKGDCFWRSRGLSKEERAAKWEELLVTNNIDPLEFAQAVYDWLEQSDHKKNCFLVHGPISTGKTLFANSIRGCLLHRQLTNSNMGGNFALGKMYFIFN